MKKECFWGLELHMWVTGNKYSKEVFMKTQEQPKGEVKSIQQMVFEQMRVHVQT